MENPKQVLGKLEAMSDPDFMEKLFDIDSLGAWNTASGVVPPTGGVQASRSHSRSGRHMLEKGVFSMSDYELLMIVLTVVGIIIITALKR